MKCFVLVNVDTKEPYIYRDEFDVDSLVIMHSEKDVEMYKQCFGDPSEDNKEFVEYELKAVATT